MRYTLTITEDVLARLSEAVFSVSGREGAAYVACGVGLEGDETRLLARDVIPVQNEHYLVRESNRLSISSGSYVHAAKLARLSGQALLFAHSHPEGYPDFSSADDQEEPRLMDFVASRAPGRPHGGIVLSPAPTFRARIWKQGSWQHVERIRILGRRFKFIDCVEGEDTIPEFFDRQVLALGPEIQRLLKRLHIGVVGAGGTGSAVIEQLTRLGVGTISVFDGDTLDSSNATRVYSSSACDVGIPKVVIQQLHAQRIGLGTRVRVFSLPITHEDTAKHLRICDVIFGCTDKQAPRSILTRLALRYLIPCFDMAIKIDALGGIIRGIFGRVTTLLCGEACLFCRGRIDPETIRAESLPAKERQREIGEGYIRGLATREPAVVMFTTAVAAQAVSEMLHRLTGFMGETRRSSEVLMFLHESRIRTTRDNPDAECSCQHREVWGIGDTKNFLGLTWG